MGIDLLPSDVYTFNSVGQPDILRDAEKFCGRTGDCVK